MIYLQKGKPSPVARPDRTSSACCKQLLRNGPTEAEAHLPVLPDAPPHQGDLVWSSARLTRHPSPPSGDQLAGGAEAMLEYNKNSHDHSHQLARRDPGDTAYRT
jgi:hypothetical protein